MNGIFLGAGASYEVGMPLVWEFSNTLRANVIKRLDSKLFNFESDPSFKGTFISILSDESKHYEEVVGELEKLYIANQDTKSTIHNVVMQLVECIQLLLLEEQANTLTLLSEKIKDYYGINRLLEECPVLNVFSLNHDIVFEEICDYFNIPYKDGFFTGKSKYQDIAKFKFITSDQLLLEDLNFFKSGDRGINLFKLHGSLDIFAAEDKKLFLKSYGDGKSIGSHLAEIKTIENHSLEICNHNGVRTTNELCVYDTDRELQFLRRSLLSGAHKFQNRFEQIAPIAFFDAFKKHLGTIDTLDVIGYGFGDFHINEVFLSWLSDKSKKLVIHDPCRDSIPAFLSANFFQIKIVKGGLTDYFLAIDSSKETQYTILARKAFNMVREKLKEKRLAMGKL